MKKKMKIRTEEQQETIGLLVRRHIVAGEFHYIGKEASTRWASGPDLSMMAEAGALDPADETFREYERIVDANYLEEIRAEAKHFSTKLLSCRSRLAEHSDCTYHGTTSFCSRFISAGGFLPDMRSTVPSGKANVCAGVGGGLQLRSQ